MNIDHRLRDGLRVQAERVETQLAPVEDVFARAQRSTTRQRAALVVVVAGLLVVGAATVTGLLRQPRVEVIEQPGVEGRVTALKLGLLDNTRIRLTLPDQLAAEPSQVELTGSLYATSSLEEVTSRTTAWRIDVTQATLEALVPDGEPIRVPDTSAAAAARLDLADRQLGLQFGSWSMVIAGDTLTTVDVDRLLDEVDLGEGPDGLPVYRGTLALWAVDGPGLQLVAGDSSLSVFLRSCSTPPDQTIGTDLTVSRIEDARRGHHLTVLCDLDNQLELWLETPSPLPDDTVAQIELEVLRVGTTLSAMQAGRTPGR